MVMALFIELENDALASIRLAFPDGYRISSSTNNPLLLSSTTKGKSGWGWLRGEGLIEDYE